MATRDPHIISETRVETLGGVAIVHEVGGEAEGETKYQVQNPAEVPAAFHSLAIDRAKKIDATSG